MWKGNYSVNKQYTDQQRNTLIRGRKPRWRGKPKLRNAEAVEHIDVFPAPPPPPDPPGYHYSWQKEWPRQDIETIIREMSDKSDYIRERAMTLTYGAFDAERRACIPDEVIDALRVKGLPDACHRVQTAAAISFVTLGLPNDAASAIVFSVMSNGDSDARWRAARCLASVGACTPEIAALLLTQLSKGSDQRQKEAAKLLCNLSKDNEIVRVLTVEELNSMDHHARLAAIKIIRHLHGWIGRDCADRLLAMMWEDWSLENRLAAAETISLSGNGEVLLRDLERRLGDEQARIRSNAVQTLGEIGKITPALVQPFIERLVDSHVSVRLDACKAAGRLNKPPPEPIVEALRDVIEKDTSTEARCMALDSMAALGDTAPVTCKLITWLIRYCKTSDVVIHSIRACATLQLRDDRSVAAIVGRTKEADGEEVRAEAVQALHQLGRQSDIKDDEKEVRIRNVLVGMCEREYTTSYIFDKEAEVRRKMAMDRMMAQAKSAMDED